MIESILISILIFTLSGHNSTVIFTHLEVIIPVAIIAVVFIVGIISSLLDKRDSIKEYKGCFFIILSLSFLTPIVWHYKSQNILSVCLFVLSFILCRFMNNSVIKANSGKMPVYPFLSAKLFKKRIAEASNDQNYYLGNSQTKLKILSDWIDVGYEIYSLGDLLSFAGYGLFFYNLITYLK